MRDIAIKGFICWRRFVARLKVGSILKGDTPAIPYCPYRQRCEQWNENPTT